MKKIFIISGFFCAITAVAQDTYLNEQTLNNSGEVIGTSRYVGMGGAMGALGADMSVISWNPAGIGLYRKSDAALTFGGYWNKSKIREENRGAASLYQVGFVYNLKTESEVCPYVNIAINFQRKKNFGSNFYADNPDLKNLSQMDQLAELANSYYSYGYDLTDVPNLAGHLVYNGELPFDQTKQKYVNNYYGKFNEYTHHSEGSLRSWDFNLSTNILDRAYLGLTFGVDNVDYDSWTNYYEGSNLHFGDDEEATRGDYSIRNYYRITGYGFNVKLGGIVRPFENNSFRLGFAVETPTWYKMKCAVDILSRNEMSNAESDIDPLPVFEFKPYTPWKFRTFMGSTIGNKFAWDIDYEYANYATMTQHYYGNFYTNVYGGTKDLDMVDHTHQTLKGVHTVRAGVEYRPISPLAFRLGYNFTSSPYKKDANFDQVNILSPSIDCVSRTNYMITKPTHILSLGMGYRWNKFYVDLAYKLRHQEADFYAFDDSFTCPGSEFSNNNPDLVNVRLDPVPVNLTRHSITCTLGIKF